MELIAAANARSLPHPIRKSACMFWKDGNDNHSIILELYKGMISSFVDLI